MGFGFVEFKEHVHALCCLRFLNNNPSFAWAASHFKSLVDLYQHCNEHIENNPHALAKLVFWFYFNGLLLEYRAFEFDEVGTEKERNLEL